MAQVNVAVAVAAFLPLVKALMLEAEATGVSGSEKHAAVAEAAEAMYKAAQSSGSIREIKDIDWALVAPLVVPVTGGLIAILVGLWNRTVGKLWASVFRGGS